MSLSLISPKDKVKLQKIHFNKDKGTCLFQHPLAQSLLPSLLSWVFVNQEIKKVRKTYYHAKAFSKIFTSKSLPFYQKPASNPFTPIGFVFSYLTFLWPSDGSLLLVSNRLYLFTLFPFMHSLHQLDSISHWHCNFFFNLSNSFLRLIQNSTHLLFIWFQFIIL